MILGMNYFRYLMVFLPLLFICLASISYGQAHSGELSLYKASIDILDSSSPAQDSKNGKESKGNEDFEEEVEEALAFISELNHLYRDNLKRDILWLNHHKAPYLERELCPPRV